MSIISLNPNTVTSKKERAKYSVMNNTGFGKLVIVQEGIKKVKRNELNKINLETAMRDYKNGLAIEII